MGASDLVTHLQSLYGDTCGDVKSDQGGNSGCAPLPHENPDVAATGLPPKTGEQALCEWRSALFVSKGVPQQQADMVAARLLERDRDMDTRRSCAERQQFTRGRCALRKQPFGGGGIEVLHRCSGFKLSEVSA